MSDLLPIEYSEPKFWDKLKKYALVAGEEVVRRALELYYALQAPDTPKWAKSIILGALAYFILPTDAIPDFIPAAGYTDDLGALAAALGAVALYITADVQAQAQAKMEQWFGQQHAVSGAAAEEK